MTGQAIAFSLRRWLDLMAVVPRTPASQLTAEQARMHVARRLHLLLLPILALVIAGTAAPLFHAYAPGSGTAIRLAAGVVSALSTGALLLHAIAYRSWSLILGLAGLCGMSLFGVLLPETVVAMKVQEAARTSFGVAALATLTAVPAGGILGFLSAVESRRIRWLQRAAVATLDAFPAVIGGMFAVAIAGVWTRGWGDWGPPVQMAVVGVSIGLCLSGVVGRAVQARVQDEVQTLAFKAARTMQPSIDRYLWRVVVLRKAAPDAVAGGAAVLVDAFLVEVVAAFIVWDGAGQHFQIDIYRGLGRHLASAYRAVGAMPTEFVWGALFWGGAALSALLLSVGVRQWVTADGSRYLDGTLAKRLAYWGAKGSRK